MGEVMFVYSAQTYTSETMSDMFAKSSYCDVRLVSDDLIQFQAHKVVLSTFSPVLKDILLKNPHPYPLIYLKGVTQQNVQFILNFMYEGEVKVNNIQKNSLLKIVKDLELKEMFVFKIEIGSPQDSVDEKLSHHVAENVDCDPNTSFVFKCTDCELSFEKRFILLRHRRKVHNISLYSCYQCEYQATHQSNLKAHQESKHKLVKKKKDKYFCNKCEYSAAKPSQLMYHQQSIHEGIRFSCNQCEYKARRPYHLESHIEAKHEGVRYSCNQCEFKAKRSAHLKLHRQSKHIGITYSCNQCEYKATRQFHLKVHKESKHEDAIYSCNICQYQATQSAILKVHKKSKHNL